MLTQPFKKKTVWYRQKDDKSDEQNKKNKHKTTKKKKLKKKKIKWDIKCIKKY